MTATKDQTSTLYIGGFCAVAVLSPILCVYDVVAHGRMSGYKASGWDDAHGIYFVLCVIALVMVYFFGQPLFVKGYKNARGQIISPRERTFAATLVGFGVAYCLPLVWMFFAVPNYPKVMFAIVVNLFFS